MNEGLHLSLCSRLYAVSSTDIIGQTGTLSEMDAKLIIAIWVPFEDAVT